jgi:hypothetical protein
MKQLNALLLSGISSLSLVACGGAGGDDSPGTEEVTVRNDPLFVWANVPLFTANDWTVPICFKGSTGEARNAIRTALRDTWEKYTFLRFTGFLECPASPSSSTVPIELITGTASSCGRGEAASGMGSRFFGSNFQVRLTVCPDHSHLKIGAVHELGHAIGFIHEHQRANRWEDHVAPCLADFEEAFPGENLQFGIIQPNYYATQYDTRSVMNYCRDWDNNGTSDLVDIGDEAHALSPQDIYGIRQIYGSYDANVPMPRAAFSTSEVGNATHNVPTQRAWNTHGLITHTITRESAGTYRVDFPKQAPNPGNFQVSALNGNARCKVHEWTASGTTLQLRVRCRNPAGTNTDSRFTAKHVYRSDSPGHGGGYVYANQPTTPSYTPAGAYTWNASNSGVNIVRIGTGKYQVTFVSQEGVTNDYGVTEVTAVGTGNQYCNVAHHNADDDGGERVTVNCFSTTGALTDTAFMLNYAHNSSFASSSFAYVHAKSPTSSSYTPARQRSYNEFACAPAPGPATVTRSGAGRYRVNFWRMWAGSTDIDLMGRSSVNVHALDSTSTGTYCNPLSWAPGLDTILEVQCYGANGTAADSSFQASLGTTYTGNCN